MTVPISSARKYLPKIRKTLRGSSGSKRRARLTSIIKKETTEKLEGHPVIGWPSFLSGAWFFLLSTHRAGLSRRRSRRLGYPDLVVVVLNKILVGAVAPTCVEVKLLHLGVNLIKIPIIKLVPINSSHRPCPVSATGAVDEKLACGRITCNLEKHPGCLFGWILSFDHWNVDVLH